MNKWKTSRRSIYYMGAPEPEDPILEKGKVALLVIDVQKTYLERPEISKLSGTDVDRYHAWTPFHERMHETVIPSIGKLVNAFRERQLETIFVRIACQHDDGRDRSLSQKKPGWNDLLLPKNAEPSQIVDELKPLRTEIQLTKTTDSALTGTNLRLILSNMGIKHVVCVGVFTDQCVSSTVRSLADESFEVIVIDDACAAASDEVHNQELEILNMIYCNVMNTNELFEYLPD